MIIKELERFDSKSYLSKIRSRNELISKERQNEVYEKCPEIEAVSRQIADFAINEIKRTGYSTLIGALFGYFCIYMTYKKHHTMNFSLQEKLITD